VRQYLYLGDTLVAEGNGTDWVYYGYGSAMYRINDTYQHWTQRGDLMAQSNLTGDFTPAPLTAPFGA